MPSLKSIFNTIKAEPVVSKYEINTIQLATYDTSRAYILPFNSGIITSLKADEPCEIVISKEYQQAVNLIDDTVEINLDFADNTASDTSSYNRTINLGAGTTVSNETGNLNQSLITIGGSSSFDLTVEGTLWQLNFNASNGTGIKTLLGYTTATTYWRIQIDLDNNLLQLINNNTTVFSTNINTAEDYYLAIHRINNKTVLYLNENIIYSSTQILIAADWATDLNIGGLTGDVSTNFFTGTIDNFQIKREVYNRPISPPKTISPLKKVTRSVAQIASLSANIPKELSTYITATELITLTITNLKATATAINLTVNYNECEAPTYNPIIQQSINTGSIASLEQETISMSLPNVYTMHYIYEQNNKPFEIYFLSNSSPLIYEEVINTTLLLNFDNNLVDESDNNYTITTAQSAVYNTNATGSYIDLDNNNNFLTHDIDGVYDYIQQQVDFTIDVSFELATSTSNTIIRNSGFILNINGSNTITFNIIGGFSYTTVGQISLNNPTHVKVAYKQSLQRLYIVINGTTVESYNAPNNNYNVQEGGPLYIGSNGSSHDWAGIFYSLRIAKEFSLGGTPSNMPTQYTFTKNNTQALYNGRVSGNIVNSGNYNRTLSGSRDSSLIVTNTGSNTTSLNLIFGYSTINNQTLSIKNDSNILPIREFLNLAGNVSVTDDPNNNQTLANITAATSLSTTVVTITDSFTSEETKTIDINSFPQVGIVKSITADEDCRVRLYYSTAARTADLARQNDTRIEGDHESFFDITAFSTVERIFAPPPVFSSTGTGYFTITNNTTNTVSITIDLEITGLVL